MTTFTLNSGAVVNYDTLTGAAGNDTFTLTVGTQLRIDTDTRYCANHTATTGNLGRVNLDSAASIYVDATNVRLIPYTSGSGNVPAIGTTITQGGVTGYLLGVWSALNAAPTAAGSAIPASGYIKLKNKAGGNYASGALSGITATASGADTVGWLEIVGVEGSKITNAANTGFTRSSQMTIQGAWFPVGTTNGSAQSFQMPASLANTYYPGVFVESAPGSGNLQFWPAAGSQVVASTLANDIRCQVCWISSQGLLRFGGDGSTTGGCIPATGCAIVVPNVVLVSCLSSAMTTNSAVNTSSDGRMQVVTNGGILAFDKVNWNWHYLFSYSPASALSNIGFLDKVWLGAPINNGGVGRSGAYTIDNYNPVYLSQTGGGFAISNFTIATYRASGYAFQILNGNGHILTNLKVQSLNQKTNYTSYINPGVYISACTNLTINGLTLIGGSLYILNCIGVSITNVRSADMISGTSGVGGITGISQSLLNFAGSSSVTLDGLSWLIPSNPLACQPSQFLMAAASSGVYRNIGTLSTPLDTSSVFGMLRGSGLFSSSKFQRIYIANAAGSFLFSSCSGSGLIIDNCWDTSLTNPCGPSPNMNSVVRGCKGPLRTTAAPAGSDGSPFVDGFSSTTVGYIAVFAALNTLANTNYVVNVGTDSALFDGAGNFTPNVSGSQVTWTTPYFIRGHSSVGGSIGVNGTTYTSASHTITYDVDTGTGFSGTWKSAATVTSIPNPATGCRIKFRWLVTGANSDAIQNFYLATVTDATTQQATYTLNAIALGVAGAVAGSVAAVYNPDASLAGTMTLAAGTETVTVFNDTTNPITGSLRLRSYGYTELTSSWSATDGPYAVPVVQYADPVAQLTAAAAGALSGLSVNWSSSTVTLTGPRSIREVYDWCKVQIAANPTKPNFISSTDGVNFTSTFNLVISGGALTGSGALNLGSNSLTISGGGSVSASLPITYAGGTRTALSFSVADIGGTALTGYEWRLYVASATAGAIGGPAVGTSEIAGAETQGTASVVVPLTISIPIAAELQIIQPGYQEYLVALTLTPAPTSLNIVLQTETNT